MAKLTDLSSHTENEKPALSWRIMKATEQACYSVFCEQEVAYYENYHVSNWRRFVVWCVGFWEEWRKLSKSQIVRVTSSTDENANSQGDH